MRVLTAEPMPSEVEALIERRRRAGADRFDEVWDGVLHISPDRSRGLIELGAAELTQRIDWPLLEG